MIRMPYLISRCRKFALQSLVLAVQLSVFILQGLKSSDQLPDQAIQPFIVHLLQVSRRLAFEVVVSRSVCQVLADCITQAAGGLRSRLWIRSSGRTVSRSCLRRTEECDRESSQEL